MTKITKLEFIFGVIIIVLVLILFKINKDKKGLGHINDILQDELNFSVNRIGQQEATIKALRLQNQLQFLTIQSKDTTIKWLQRVVKDYQGELEHALVLANTTSSIGITGTVVEYDTIYESNTIYPIYSTMWENKWERGCIRATRDSIYREIKISNEFEFTVGDKKTGFFKREYLASVINLNPNTLTTELQSVTFKPKLRRIGIGLNTGYGITGKGFSWYAGVGFYFRII